MPNRIEYLDIAKGVGILCIVIGHYAIPQWLHNLIYSFHVPLFFIVSGYFIKKRTLLETIKKGWKQLLRPMWITIVIAMFLKLIVGLLYDGRQSPHGFDWIANVFLMTPSDSRIPGMWFLISLFWGKLWVCCLDDLISYVQLVIAAGLYGVGYLLHTHISTIPWLMDCGMMVPLYLYTGMYLQKYAIVENLAKSQHILIILMIIICLSPLSPVNLSEYDLPYGVLSVMSSMIIPIAVLCVLKKMSDILCFISWKFIKIGYSSLLILCLHSVIHSFYLQALPPIGYVYHIMSFGIVAVIECIVLVITSNLLNRVRWVNLVFIGRRL